MYLTILRNERLPLATIKSFPPLQAVLEAWERAAGQRLPPRLDPAEIPRKLLPLVLIYDLEEPAGLLRVRLAGTVACDRHGAELRGLTPADFFSHADAALVEEDLRTVLAEGRPALVFRECELGQERLWRYAQVALPLSSNGDKPDRILAVTDPLAPDEEFAARFIAKPTD